MRKRVQIVFGAILGITILSVVGGILDLLTTAFGLSVDSGDRAVVLQSLVYLITDVIHLAVIGNIFLWMRRRQPRYILIAAYFLLANMTFDFVSLALPKAVREARSEDLPSWLWDIGPVFEFVPPGVGSGVLALILMYVEKACYEQAAELPLVKSEV